jgi:hypothetical protein
LKKYTNELNRAFQGRSPNDLKLHKEMLTITSHKGNTNQNNTKIPTHCHYNGYHQEYKKLMFSRMSKKKEPSYAASGNVN